MDFYQNLLIACDRAGIKVSRAVTDAGEKLGSLNGWKNGAVPSAKAVRALAIRLNVTSDFLLDLPAARPASAPAGSAALSEMVSIFPQLSEESQQMLLDVARSALSRQEKTAALV